MWIVVLFLAVPLIEIGLFVTLGSWLGLWPTLAFVLGSAVLGVAVLQRVGRMGRRGGSPVMQIAGSGLSMVAATLLVMPGFLTSFLGVLLLLPPLQKLLVVLLGQRLAARVFTFHTQTQDKQRGDAPDVIDGEFDVVEQPQDKRLPPSRWTQH